MKKTADFISWLFLPLLTPVYGLLIAMYVPSDPDINFWKESLFYLKDNFKALILATFFIFSVVAPGISFLILRQRNIITTIDMENQNERSIPMFISLIYCLMLYFLFIVWAPNNALPKYVYALPLAGVFVTTTYAFINRWIKISLHGGGVGILSGFIFAYAFEQMDFQFWILIFVILASGLTISARLFLRKHTPLEVYTGWSLATLLTFLVNYYYPIG